MTYYPESRPLRFRLRFTGADGSLGFRTGRVYDLVVRYEGDGRVSITMPVRCPYRSWVTFWQNWQVPDAA